MIQKIECGSKEIWKQVLGPLQTNCYLVVDKDTKDAVLIDPAENCPAIMEMQKKADAHIRGIFLTHGHYDHMGAAREAKEVFHTDIYACEDEKMLLADGRMNYSAIAGSDTVLTADKWLKDGEMVSLGGISFQAIQTPGHTKGGMCYYFKEDDLLISGDTLFFENVGRTDLPTGTGRQIMVSIKEKLFVLPEETLVLPGHGPETSIGYEKKNNPYMDDNYWE